MTFEDELPKIDKTSKMWRTAVEVQEPETVSIEGKIPDWLNGNYFRVGPGKLDIGDNFSMNHWIDGYALISRFDIDSRNQKVTFQSRYLESETYKKAMKEQKPMVAEFATPANMDNRKGFFSRVMSQIVPEMTDNTNHALFTLGSHSNYGNQSTILSPPLFTTNDSGYMNEVDPVTLACKEQLDSKKLFKLNVCTPHPLTDTETSYSYNIGSSVVLSGLKYNIIRIPPSTTDTNYKEQLKQSNIICSISSQWTSYLSFNHSFGMTQQFIIYIEQPLVVNVSKLLTSSFRSKGESSKDWLEWRTDSMNRFHIIEKSTGRLLNRNIMIVSSEPFFFFHFINSYEDSQNNQIVIDLSTYETAEVLLGDSQLMTHVRNLSLHEECGREKLLKSSTADSKRFLIPLSLFGIDITNGTTTKTEDNNKLNTTYTNSNTRRYTIIPEPIVIEKGLELPVINKNFMGKSYQYFYASGLLSQGLFKNAVCKIDVILKKVISCKISDYFIFGEPIFSSGDSNEVEIEDEGVLIVPMTDIRKTEQDMIFFFDAKNMVEIGRATFNNSVHPAIHGIFIPKIQTI